MTISVAVFGASGRLGSLICALIEAEPGLVLHAALRSTSDPAEAEGAEVVVDVSTPDASADIVARAVGLGQRVIVGTSGWSAARLDELRTLVEAHPGSGVLVVPNFSLGSVLGTVLARIAGRFSDSIEIIEAHHPHKVDSPSGTAVRTAELIAADRAGRPVTAPAAEQPARGQLVAGIPVHSLRLAGVVAKQEVRLGGPGEVLTITHDTHSQDAYRGGVLRALAAAPGLTGLTVGLDTLLGLDALAAALDEAPAGGTI
ncbi:4-hydroxy-tetrahydrodipicolinate reductase [Leucobacter sp. M11]|uniref:4-hydroxy-tetrahydrodipicolinate reductase n=1 Tax=Leucobacter sp. M11 TaxID=2993565 RepID=UPI002D80A566|nr:4-hydroxy-tetrahydrodipicolinate reductase [Leucobacter sp. M11]MEB4615875.1 4-hydroxy-tetrahydrodipicolinate reductase [Leucobacter sp. M11]